MIEQQLTLASDREMLLYWGVTDTGDFYDLENLTAWAASDPHFRATLTARHDSLGFRAPVGVRFHMGMAYQALAESELDLGSRDTMSQDRLKRWPRSSRFWLWPIKEAIKGEMVYIYVPRLQPVKDCPKLQGRLRHILVSTVQTVAIPVRLLRRKND